MPRRRRRHCDGLGLGDMAELAYWVIDRVARVIDAALFARIRRLFFAEHWKVGTIATELGVHHDTVDRAIESDCFVRTQSQLQP